MQAFLCVDDNQNNRVLDEGYDLVIHMDDLPDSGLVACASPDYLARNDAF